MLRQTPPCFNDVVIPLYNGSKWISETLDSVFKQSLSPGRIIVVDDGSTDDSYDIVSKLPNVILLRNPGKGVASARNFGFEHTTAPFLAFLDQDDVWHPDHLRILSEALARNPGVPAIASELTYFIDGANPKFDLSDTSLELFDPWNTYPAHTLACCPSLTIFKRQAFVDSGGWPVMHNNLSDYSLWLRLAVKKPLIRLRVRTVAYRRHQTSLTVNIRTKNPIAHLESILKIDNDLMEYYLNYSDNEQEKIKIKRRNQAVRYMHDLILALSNNERTSLPKLISELEERTLRYENEEYRTYVLKHVCNILSLGFTPGNNSQEFRAYLITLLEIWPKDVRITFKTLQNVIIEERPGSYFYLNYYLRNPLQLSRVSFLFKAAIRRLSKKNNRR